MAVTKVTDRQAVQSVDLTSEVTNTLPVVNGGTGQTTLTANNVLLGNGTSAVAFVAAGTNGNVLTDNGTTWVSSAPTGGGGSPNPLITTVTTAAGTTTLTVTSDQVYAFTGTTTQTVSLPTTSVGSGNQWLFLNYSTGAVTVKASGGATVIVLAGNTSAIVTANAATPTTAAGWDVQYDGVTVTSGKVLNVANSITLSGTDGDTFNVDAIPVTSLTGATTIASTVATSTTTDTKIASFTIAASTVSAGETFQARSFGTQSTTSGTLTWKIHLGTAGTTADATVTTVAAGVAASGGAHFQGLLTVRTTGSSGTCMASGLGMGSTSVVSTNTATTTVNTTVQNFVTLSVAASAGTHTTQTALVTEAQA